MKFMKNFGNWVLNKMTGRNYSGFFSKAGRLVKDSKDLWIYGNNTIDRAVYKSRGLNGVYKDVKKDYPGIKTRAVRVKDDFKNLFNINNSYSPTPKPTTSGGPGSKHSGKTGSPNFSKPKPSAQGTAGATAYVPGNITPIYQYGTPSTTAPLTAINSNNSQNLEDLVDVSEEKGLTGKVNEEYSVYDLIKGRKVIKQDIQNNLAYLYANSGSSVKEIARLCNVSSSTVSKYGRLINSVSSRRELKEYIKNKRYLLVA